MPKARRSKKAAKIGTAQSRIARTSQNTAVAQRGAVIPDAAPTPARPAGADRRFVSPRVAGPQTLIFPAMVALGCWGMAFSLAYFYTEPNRFIFAGMAVLMGLLWTYSLVMRIRKLLALRQTK